VLEYTELGNAARQNRGIQQPTYRRSPSTSFSSERVVLTPCTNDLPSACRLSRWRGFCWSQLCEYQSVLSATSSSSVLKVSLGRIRKRKVRSGVRIRMVMSWCSGFLSFSDCFLSSARFHSTYASRTGSGSPSPWTLPEVLRFHSAYNWRRGLSTFGSEGIAVCRFMQLLARELNRKCSFEESFTFVQTKVAIGILSYLF
jgi:hypothetical protein